MTTNPPKETAAKMVAMLREKTQNKFDVDSWFDAPNRCVWVSISADNFCVKQAGDGATIDAVRKELQALQ